MVVLLKGAIAKKKEPKDERTKKATKEVFSVKNGLSGLIKELTTQIGEENIVLNVSKTDIKQIHNGFNITYYTNSYSKEITCNKLVTTCPANNMHDILTFAEKKEIDTIENVDYAPVTQLILGYNNWDGISVKAFGGLVPSIEKRDILGVLFTSSFFKNRALDNSVLLSVFIGGKRKPEIIKKTDEELIKLGLNEIKKMLKPKDATLELSKVYKHQFAIPQYEISSEIRFDMANQLEKKYNGLIIGGNLKDGIGMADRIKQARNMAERIFSQTKNN